MCFFEIFVHVHDFISVGIFPPVTLILISALSNFVFGFQLNLMSADPSCRMLPNCPLGKTYHSKAQKRISLFSIVLSLLFLTLKRLPLSCGYWPCWCLWRGYSFNETILLRPLAQLVA